MTSKAPLSLPPRPAPPRAVRLDRVVGALRALPAAARFLLLSSSVGSLATGFMLVFLPLYLHGLGLPAGRIGTLYTLVGLGAAAVMLAGGPLADRFGRRPFLLIGTALPILGFALFAGAGGYWWLVAASLLCNVTGAGGVGDALVTDTLTPTLTAVVDPPAHTAVLSWTKAAWMLCLGLGMFLAILPDALADAHIAPPRVVARALFVLGLLLTVGATLLLLPARTPKRAPARPTPAAGAAKGPAVVGAAGGGAVRRALPLLFKITVFYLLQGAGLGLAVQLLPLWFALRFHTHTGAIVPWFAAAQLAGAPLVLLAPAVIRRIGTAGVIVLTVALGAVALAGVALAPLFAVAGLCVVLRAAALALQWPALRIFLLGSVPPAIRGTTMALALGSWSVAAALLPTVAGALLDRGLVLWPLILGVLCYGAAALWFWLALRHTARPARDTQEGHDDAARPVDRMRAR